jgi:hypothetical protein
MRGNKRTFPKLSILAFDLHEFKFNSNAKSRSEDNMTSSIKEMKQGSENDLNSI